MGHKIRNGPRCGRVKLFFKDVFLIYLYNPASLEFIVKYVITTMLDIYLH